MTQKDSDLLADLLARLTVVNQSLDRVHQNIAELLRRAAQRHDTTGLQVSELRGVGHRLVSLAGDLTTLGVDTARWADEVDHMIDTDGEDDNPSL
jgi:hypothetical protein